MKKNVLCAGGVMFGNRARALVVGVMLLSTVAIVGCSATLVPPDGLSDARVQSVELQRRVTELEGKSAELQAQLAAAQEQIARANAVGAVDREVAEATPRMVTLAFAGGSSEWTAVAADAGPTRHAIVRVAVEPRDGLGR
ncbi:MAG: hypothetical protein WCO75_06405, partial [Planctomycetota bacterium]